MIHINNVNIYKKGNLMIQDINLEIDRNTLFLGENNSGKTELLKSICGKKKLSSGSIILDEYFVKENNLSKKNNGIMYVPKFYMNFFKNLSIKNIILFFTKQRFISSRILEDMNINAKSLFGKLSYIQMLAVFIDIGLRNNKKIFILDEPEVFLDFKEQKEFRELIDNFLSDCLLIISSNNSREPFYKIEQQYFISNNHIEKTEKFYKSNP